MPFWKYNYEIYHKSVKKYNPNEREHISASNVSISN